MSNEPPVKPDSPSEGKRPRPSKGGTGAVRPAAPPQQVVVTMAEPPAPATPPPPRPRPVKTFWIAKGTEFAWATAALWQAGWTLVAVQADRQWVDARSGGGWADGWMTFWRMDQ